MRLPHIAVLLLGIVSNAAGHQYELRRRRRETSCSATEVTALKLIDPVSDTVEDPCTLGPYPSCDVINLNFFEDAEINILAETCSPDESIECVKFFLENEVIGIELNAPYAMFGNNGGNFYGGTLPSGLHDIKACTYTSSDCSTGESGCLTWDGVTVYECWGINEDIFAIDSEADECIFQLNKSYKVCLPQSGKLTFVAVYPYYSMNTPHSCIDEVHMELIKPDGTKDVATEQHYPWSLYGNTGNDYYGRSLSPGRYTFSAWADDGDFKPTYEFDILAANDPICTGLSSGNCGSNGLPWN